jgi:GTP pyrophosphokinase
MLTALARCCKPAPPDEIAGFVTRGKGVSVHRAQCPTFARMSQATPERVIATQWGEQRAGSEARYPIDAVIHAKSRPDLLRVIAEVLAREKIPLIRINSFPKGDQVTMVMTLQVADGHQLSKALSMLRDITGVQSASRA